eukprot:scaffold475847_cov24-Prasinocladus_malaysianus.AAC.1
MSLAVINNISETSRGYEYSYRYDTEWATEQVVYEYNKTTNSPTSTRTFDRTIEKLHPTSTEGTAYDTVLVVAITWQESRNGS